MRLTLVIAALLLAAPAAHAQFLDAGDAPSGDGGGDLESDEGLQSATPTDNVNELNSNGGNPANGGGAGGEGNFPAQNAPGDFDIENTGDEGGNDFFTNGAQPANLGGQQAAPSAFGNGAEDKTGANAAKDAPPGGKPAQFVEPVPVQTAPVNQTAPLNQTAPANAAALMNQLANPAANPAGNPAADPNATTTATGKAEQIVTATSRDRAHSNTGPTNA